MMLGAYARTLDAKHRLVLPPALRRGFGAEVYVARASARRLVMVPDAAELVDRGLALDTYPVLLMPSAGVWRWTVPLRLRGWLGARPGQEVLMGGDGKGVIVGRNAAQLLLPLEGEW